MKIYGYYKLHKTLSKEKKAIIDDMCLYLNKAFSKDEIYIYWENGNIYIMVHRINVDEICISLQNNEWRIFILRKGLIVPCIYEGVEVVVSLSDPNYQEKVISYCGHWIGKLTQS